MNGFVTKVRIKADATGEAPKVINLLKTGKWNTTWHGDFELTVSDLKEMATHFEQGVGLVVEDEVKAPINYGHLMADKASGWITRAYVKEDGDTAELMGEVEWTPAAAQAIKDGEWKYLSPEFNPRGCPWEDPEQEFTFVDNVLTGAALTNIPLFKKLKPITASRVPPKKAVNASRGSVDASEKIKEGERMDLEELRAKEVKDLTDEEKQFLVDNKDKLTDDERKALGIEEEEEEKKEASVNASTKTEAAKDKGGKAIEASAIAGRVTELEAQLKASREESEALRSKIETKEVEEFLDARIKAGQIKQDQRESWSKTLLASRGDARTALETQLKELPVNETIGKELGDKGADTKVEASRELHQKVVEKISASREAGKTISYFRAEQAVLASDTALAARVKEEEEA